MAPAEDWVARTAELVRAEGERRHPGEAPTCASGISPSGPVHLGNLRELMVPHLIADEVRRGGARHPVFGRSHMPGHLPLFPQPSGYKEPAPGRAGLGQVPARRPVTPGRSRRSEAGQMQPVTSK